MHPSEEDWDITRECQDIDEEYLDVEISEAHPESNDGITIVGCQLAPGPSGDGKVVSKRAPESDVDLEDSDIIVVSWFQLSSIFVPHCQQTAQTDVGQTAASDVDSEDSDIIVVVHVFFSLVPFSMLNTLVQTITGLRGKYIHAHYIMISLLIHCT